MAVIFGRGLFNRDETIDSNYQSKQDLISSISKMTVFYTFNNNRAFFKINLSLLKLHLIKYFS